MSRKRALIVGAGPGGLAAAMLLSRAGVEVDVFERLPRVGGRTHTFEQEGFRFDLGPTFFMYPRVLKEIFAQCGRDLMTEVPMTRLDPQYRLQFGAGGQLDATRDIETMEARIRELAPGDERGFRRLLDDNRGKLERFRPVLESAFTGWRDLLRPEVLGLVPDLKPWRSVHGELGRYFSDERLKLAFTFQAKYLGMSPFRCPSIFTILSYLEYEHGVWHPTGGFGSLSEAMARVAQAQGARIHLGEPVDELVYTGDRVTGLRTRSGLQQGDAVVVNADFARAMKRLVPNARRPRWSDRKIARARFSCSTFMMYLGVRGTFPELPHHTIHVPSGYREHLEDIETRRVLTDEPSFYVQNACVTDPGQAPDGHSTLYVLVPVPHRTANVDWSREKDSFRRRILRQLAKVGLHDVEQRIVTERVITPDEWDTRYEVHDGAVFNLAHDLRQMLHLRPRNRFTDVDGMYLVGGGTHPGSGLPVIYEGARITSRLLTEDLGVAVDWSVPDAPVASPAREEVA